MVADVKRGDIATTAEAYAAAFLEPRGGRPPLADVMTVNPYMGGDSVEPFLRACRDHGAGIFCLMKTSNPGSGDLQDLPLADGRPLWNHVAGLVDRWGADLVGASGLSSVGAVLGATHPGVLETARRLLPRAVFLILGRRAGRSAGGRRAGVRRPSGRRARLDLAADPLRPRSRGGDWREAAAAEATGFAEQLRAAAPSLG